MTLRRNYWTRCALALALLGGAALGAGCDEGMGGACVDSGDCRGDGVCLKGACAAYSCEPSPIDGEPSRDCADGFECALIGGSRVCAQPCADDRECPGAQACTDISDGGGRYCL